MPFGSRCSWDNEVEQTAVTANPAAGVISVDVKTFTGRGRVSYVSCSCTADAFVATRQLQAFKVSGANLVLLGESVTFTATGSTTMYLMRGGPVGLIGTARYGMADIDFAPGDILRLVVSGGQAGDDLSAITYSFKEML